jgi:hypothetical protein
MTRLESSAIVFTTRRDPIRLNRRQCEYKLIDRLLSSYPIRCVVRLTIRSRHVAAWKLTLRLLTAFAVDCCLTKLMKSYITQLISFSGRFQSTGQCYIQKTILKCSFLVRKTGPGNDLSSLYLRAVYVKLGIVRPGQGCHIGNMLCYTVV